MGTTPFTYVDDGREPWDRHKGESGEQFDWFRHWLNDGHRRSFPRTADKFGVKPHTVRNAAKRNRWTERKGAYDAEQSRQVRERVDEVAERAMVPFVQAMARLAAHAATAPIDSVTPDRALTAATGAMRMLTEPTVRDLIRVAAAAGAREFDALDVVLDALAKDHPDAHDAALDALAATTDQPAAGAGETA